MEWVVFTTVLALITFVKTVVTPIIKLNTTIINLTISVDNMAKTISKLEAKNSDNHNKIYAKLDEHEKKLTIYDGRIKNVERKQYK